MEVTGGRRGVLVLVLRLRLRLQLCLLLGLLVSEAPVNADTVWCLLHWILWGRQQGLLWIGMLVLTRLLLRLGLLLGRMLLGRGWRSIPLLLGGIATGSAKWQTGRAVYF